MSKAALVRIERNDCFTDTLIVAKGTGIAHRRVKDQIRRYESQFTELGLSGAYQTESSGGRPEEIYLLYEPQASFLITLLKNTPAVVKFKLELVKQFYAMRLLLLERQTADWQQARALGKQARLEETDAIKALMAYAEAQGSKNFHMLYLSYSKLIKSLGGYETRDSASTEVLQMIAAFERLLAGIITVEMHNDTHYKAIYQKAKGELHRLKVLWFPVMPRLGA